MRRDRGRERGKNEVLERGREVKNKGEREMGCRKEEQ